MLTDYGFSRLKCTLFLSGDVQPGKTCWEVETWGDFCLLHPEKDGDEISGRYIMKKKTKMKTCCPFEKANFKQKKIYLSYCQRGRDQQTTLSESVY